MEREKVIKTRQAYEPTLKAAGVASMSLFGSVARNDAGQDSDVDIAVRLADNFSGGGFDYFGRMEALEGQLSQMLGCRVDVVEEPVRKRRFQQQIDRERALAF
jgi:hypothetical protein